jgi:hypothetical protein
MRLSLAETAVLPASRGLSPAGKVLDADLKGENT